MTVAGFSVIRKTVQTCVTRQVRRLQGDVAAGRITNDIVAAGDDDSGTILGPYRTFIVSQDRVLENSRPSGDNYTVWNRSRAVVEISSQRDIGQSRCSRVINSRSSGYRHVRVVGKSS